MRAIPAIQPKKSELHFDLKNIRGDLSNYTQLSIVNWLKSQIQNEIREDHNNIFIVSNNEYIVEHLQSKLIKDIKKDKVLNTLSYRIGINKVRFGNEWINFSELNLSTLYFELANEYKSIQFFNDFDPTYFMYNRELEYIKTLCKL